MLPVKRWHWSKPCSTGAGWIAVLTHCRTRCAIIAFTLPHCNLQASERVFRSDRPSGPFLLTSCLGNIRPSSREIASFSAPWGNRRHLFAPCTPVFFFTPRKMEMRLPARNTRLWVLELAKKARRVLHKNISCVMSMAEHLCSAIHGKIGISLAHTTISEGGEGQTSYLPELQVALLHYSP